MINFNLGFPKSEITSLSDRYLAAHGKEDEAAFRRAAQIRAHKGAHTSQCLDDLYELIAWKSERRLDLVDYNDPEEIFEAVDVAIEAKHERTAMAVLCGLDGVGVPMASAILTAMFQGNEEKFTIIDWRALESLGVMMESPPLWFYLEYLDYCHDHLKAGTDHSLRTIDRALWQWSWEKSNSR